MLMVAGFVAAVGILQQIAGAEALNRLGYEYDNPTGTRTFRR